MRNQDFRYRLRQTGATEALIEAYGRFKELMLRRDISGCQSFVEVLTVIVEGERRDYLDLTDVRVPIEHLYALTVADLVQQFEFRARQAEWTEAESLCNQGWDLHIEGRDDEALERLQESIRISPRFCLGWINKGIVLKSMGRFGDALACYKHITDAIDSCNERAFYNEAYAIVTRAKNDEELTEDERQKVLREAIGLLDKALEVDPEYAKAVQLRAELQQGQLP
jgi:tetratricopeptide (TPR) repeat protein